MLEAYLPCYSNLSCNIKGIEIRYGIFMFSIEHINITLRVVKRTVRQQFYWTNMYHMMCLGKKVLHAIQPSIKVLMNHIL